MEKLLTAFIKRCQIFIALVELTVINHRCSGEGVKDSYMPTQKARACKFKINGIMYTLPNL